MPQALFRSAQQPHAADFSFSHPLQVLIAHHPEEVLRLVADAEFAAQSGLWVALLLSYEAAAAFDDALVTKQPGEFPLAWAAVFERPDCIAPGSENITAELGPWKPGITFDTYHSAIESIREFIAAGETYQVNFTYPLQAQFTGDPIALFHALCTLQNSDYSAYLDLGRFKVLSVSPELFFKRLDNSIATRPMKGTMRRGRWLEEDLQLAGQLHDSAKEQAENVMIVDLLRNDLGKIALAGTVAVTDLFAIERYPTLWQMTSTVRAELSPSTSLQDILRALFPCGSVTGAPKVGTMKIIRDLEVAPRAIYTGTIGLLRPGGDCTFNVAIRTLLLDTQTGLTTFGTGGGITFDSSAESEFAESLLKASFLTQRAPSFELFETMLLEDGEFYLLERHLCRLKNSCAYFNFPDAEEGVRNALAQLAQKNPVGQWRIQLYLSSKGKIETKLAPLPQHKDVVRVALANVPVDETDPFLFHKTTYRDVYEHALVNRPDVDDVLLWNRNGEITESTIANVVIDSGGKLWTPRREAGLLAGTFREELLRNGKLSERVIEKDEVKEGQKFFLINSVRKWMNAVIVS